MDDDPKILRVLRDIMKHDGYEVLTAMSGEEAIEIVERAAPCIVITDVMMPGMDGITLCHRLTAGRTTPIPVVLVTGKISDDDVTAGISAGAVDYIKKPFDKAETRMRVRTLIRLHESLIHEKRIRAELSAISSTTTDAIVIADNKGRIAHWNEAAETMFGYPRQAVLGREMRDLIIPDRYREQHQAAFASFRKTGQGRVIGRTIELAALRANGEEIPVELSLSSALIEGKWHAVAILRDITERKQVEAEMIHARKLEAVGQLASGVAHEINTPIQFVGDNIHFLAEGFDEQRGLLRKYKHEMAKLEADGSHEEMLNALAVAEGEADLEFLEERIPIALESCLEGVSRISSIVGALKEFAHPGGREKSFADINRALKTTLTIAKNEYKYVADLETELGDLPPVSCNLGDLNQVFLNLIVNAAHAIGDVVGETGNRGVIHVETVDDGDVVRIVIRDNGAGIPEAIRERIFEPFFTTKEPGKGSGQGLAIARAVVVDRHNGSITCESVVGEGTTFTICLPVDRQEGRRGVSDE